MAEYRKAIIGALMAFLAALGTAMSDGTVTGIEWVIIAGAVVTGFGAVWGVPNAPAMVRRD